MIALWLPLWSLIGPDEGFIFLIIVFAFFITISIIVKFRSQSDMSCTIGARNLVAQECMALTQNPFQFRLSVLKDENYEVESNKADEIDNDELNKDKINEKKSEGSNESDELEGGEKANEKANLEPKPSTSQVDEEIHSFKKGVKIDIFCKIDFHLCYFWGVNIDQFHNFMRLNSQSFYDRLLDGSLFEQSFLEKNEPKLINGSDQVRTIRLTCSDKVTPESLGQSPRTCYPLIVILARDLSKEEEQNKNENDVLFMINVLHVKDNVCPLETNVITRLLKKRSGLTINLQTLYTPSDDLDESSNSAICVICQENFVSVALLPCKHSCICLECFTKIDKCPLCRSYIRSYFMLKPITEASNQEQAPQNTENNPNNQATTETSPDSNQQQQNQNRGFFKKVGSKFSNLFK